MPGSSLWLLPPKSHPLNELLTSLIKTITASFNSPHTFIPHITLSSEISPQIYSKDPQTWLEKLPFPSANDVPVKFDKLQTEDFFFRRMTIKVEKNESIKELGTIARRSVKGFADEEVAEQWSKETYSPHLSLLYSDMSISETELKRIGSLIQEAGISLEAEGERCGWIGGRVVLVPTDREIKDWNPIAEREL